VTSLLYCVWEVTLRCDLACNHCGSRAGKAREDELSTAEALDVVKQLKDMGCQEVTLIGGEAYLRLDWTEIAAAVVDAGMLCTMTTGGRGLSPERAAAAKAAGMSSVSVSVDGLAEVHDRLRGLKGSWERATEAIRNVRAAGLHVSANTQVNRLNRHQLSDLLDRLIEWGCFAWQVQLTVPMGRAADNWEWLLQPYEVLEVVPQVVALKERAAKHDLRVFPGNNVGYFGPHETALRGDIFSRGHSPGCTAGLHTLGLEASGNVKGCPSLTTADYTGGNVRQRSIRDIWDTSAELRFAREHKVELWGRCASCYYAADCRGGCTWTAHLFSGRPGNNPYCHHRALEYDRVGLRERFKLATPAPGEPFDHALFDLYTEPSEQSARSLPVVSRDGA
jgi:radical SAM protein with 4Fe4S-binding SPASM domain